MKAAFPQKMYIDNTYFLEMLILNFNYSSRISRMYTFNPYLDEDTWPPLSDLPGWWQTRESWSWHSRPWWSCHDFHWRSVLHQTGHKRYRQCDLRRSGHDTDLPSTTSGACISQQRPVSNPRDHPAISLAEHGILLHLVYIRVSW